MTADGDRTIGFKVFRAAEAPSLYDTDCMAIAPFDPKILASMAKASEAGMFEGEEVRVLFSVPGFSLTHAWFKPHYPLPLHTHDADCLYYVVAGSLELGSETLGAGDGFFVPADHAYSYRPGASGVEVLEFRHATQFNFINRANNPAFWDKAAATIASNRDAWKVARKPSLP